MTQPASRPPGVRTGIALALAGFSLYACGDAIVKHLSANNSTNAIMFFGTLFCVCFLLLPVLVRQGPRPIFCTKQAKWYALRGMFLAVQMTTIIYSFSHNGLAETYAILFCAPFFTALLARLGLHEAVAPRQWLAIALGFAGVLVILRPGLIPLTLPTLAALLSSLTFALSNLTVRRGGRGDDSVLVMGLLPQMVIFLCVIPLFLLAPAWPGTLDLFWLALMSAFNVAGYLCMSLAFLKAPASVAAPFHYVQMLWGLAFGYFLFGDMPDRWVLAGAAIVIASGLWLLRQSRDPHGEIIPKPFMPPAVD